VYVALAKSAVAALHNAATEFSFVVTSTEGNSSAERKAIFQGPER
jgi:hypothetical protein